MNEPHPLPPAPSEARALRVLHAAALLGIACIAMLPFGMKRAAAEALSRDGELGMVTLELLRWIGPVAWLCMIAGAACWWGRGVLREVLARVFRVIEAGDSRAFLLRLVALAVALRVAWIVFVPTFPANDFLEYHELAMRLAETGRFITAEGAPTAFRPPGYPALLALFYAILGPELWIGKLLNVALGAVISILTWLLVRGAAGERAGRLAGILVAVFPSMVGYTSLHASEIPSTAAMLASLWVASRAVRVLNERSGGEASANGPLAMTIGAARSGGWLAISCLIRPTIALFPCALALVMWAHVGWRRTIPWMLVFSLAMAPPFVAWGLRNSQKLGAFVPLSTNGGVNLYFGNNAISNGTGLEMLDPKNDATSGITNEAERNARGMELGLQYWREHPGALPALFARKVMWLVGTDGVWTRWTMISAEPRSPEGARRVLAALSTAMWWGLLLLALIEWTVFRVRAASRAFAEPFGESMVLYTVVMTALLIGQERYHFPLVPIVCGGAATLLVRLAATRTE